MMLFPTTRDPIEDDPFVIQARAEEAAREQRWITFVAWVQKQLLEFDLDGVCVLRDVIAAMGVFDELDEEQIVYKSFAETEGWPGVLTAIARAMREAEQAQQELMNRR